MLLTSLMMMMIACRLIPTYPGVAEPEDACFADFAEDSEQSDDI